MRIRKAVIGDVKEIHSLINKFAKKDKMLPRSLNEIYENIRDFFVCIDRGRVVGVSAIHILWEDLAELRSIAVLNGYQGKGIGKELLKYCIKEAKRLGIKRVFALTYHPEFFRDSGFKDIDKNRLPQKIWGDCLKCPKFPECDEVAVIKEL
ncbi:MAG: N-acetyltransferase [Thermodesulfovibrionia bacterium]